MADKTCFACANSYMEPDSPYLVCGHPSEGVFGTFIKRNLYLTVRIGFILYNIHYEIQTVLQRNRMLHNKKVYIPLEHLTQQYFEVSKCWQDPKRAVVRNMTVEKALLILRNIQEAAMYRSNGKGLAKKADLLADAIVLTQEEPKGLEEAITSG